MSEVAGEHVCGVVLRKRLRDNENLAQTASLLERHVLETYVLERLVIEELRDFSNSRRIRRNEKRTS